MRHDTIRRDEMVQNKTICDNMRQDKSIKYNVNKHTTMQGKIRHVEITRNTPSQEKTIHDEQAR